VKGSSKLEKGFRDSDIRYYQTIKSRVMEERRAVKDSPPPHDSRSANQLIFHYPSSSQHQVKVEATISSRSKKRKAMGDLVVGDFDTNDRQNLAMSLADDDDDDAFCSTGAFFQM
jgi:hypothetical protein